MMKEGKKECSGLEHELHRWQHHVRISNSGHAWMSSCFNCFFPVYSEQGENDPTRRSEALLGTLPLIQGRHILDDFPTEKWNQHLHNNLQSLQSTIAPLLRFHSMSINMSWKYPFQVLFLGLSCLDMLLFVCPSKQIAPAPYSDFSNSQWVTL